MPDLWRAGLLAERLTKAASQGEERLAAAVRELGLTVERGAKVHAADGGSHRYGQPTTAARGSGPAIVSGTLRRSIISTRLRATGFGGWQMEVGMAAGVYPPKPPYPPSAKTASSLYGLYLETVWDYPFLGPAYRQAMAGAQAIWLKHFSLWPNIRG